MWEKIQASDNVKYLGIYLYEYLDWSPHINHLSHKLVKANAMLYKLCHYENEATVKSIYYAIFHSHLSYICAAWGQNLNPKYRINLLKKKATQIISFAQYDAHTLSIFEKLNIIKFSDLNSLCNYLFIYKHFISKSPSVYSQGLTNLIFACTDFRARKMVSGAGSCTQNYLCIKQSLGH